MRLTQFSEYALRLLSFAAAHPDRLITVEQAAKAHDISRTHLMKVANLLAREGYLKAMRGRSGGLMLARAPEAISLGALVRLTEPAFAVLECAGEAEGRSALRQDRWRAVLTEAMDAFLAELDRHTVRDLLAEPLRHDMGLAKPAA
jgi:Rrf2 family nitric oxide-sensitive transcriptional repressor